MGVFFKKVENHFVPLTSTSENEPKTTTHSYSNNFSRQKSISDFSSVILLSDKVTTLLKGLKTLSQYKINQFINRFRDCLNNTSIKKCFIKNAKGEVKINSLKVDEFINDAPRNFPNCYPEIVINLGKFTTNKLFINIILDIYSQLRSELNHVEPGEEELNKIFNHIMTINIKKEIKNSIFNESTPILTDNFYQDLICEMPGIDLIAKQIEEIFGLFLMDTSDHDNSINNKKPAYWIIRNFLSEHLELIDFFIYKDKNIRFNNEIQNKVESILTPQLHRIYSVKINEKPNENEILAQKRFINEFIKMIGKFSIKLLETYYEKNELATKNSLERQKEKRIASGWIYSGDGY